MRAATTLLHEQHQHPENIMPLQWTSEDVDDVSFTAYLSIDMDMNDEQISDLIYQCRKAKNGSRNGTQPRWQNLCEYCGQ